MFDAILPIDQQIVVLVNQTWIHPILDKFFMTVTSKDAMLLPMILLMGFVWWKGDVKERVAVVLAVFAIMLGDLFGEMLKQNFARPRPYLNPSLIDSMRVLGGESTNSPSFPSNHALNTWAMAVPMIVFCWCRFRWVVPFFIAFALAVSYSRVYVGVHYASDICAGALIGIVAGGLLCLLQKYLPLCRRDAETGRLQWGWSGMAILLVAILTGIRLSFLTDANIDLSFEETQYWDWSRRLDYGYFSKPPMVAWIIHIFTQIIGASTPFWVRLPSVLTGILLMWASWHFMTLLGADKRTRFIGLVVAATMPLFAAGSVLFTTDTPLLVGWTFALIFLWQALRTEALRYWFLCGVAMGFGLLSKYSMFYFHACLLLMLVCTPALRFHLRRKGVWIACVISLLMLVPPLYWNYTHDWVSFFHVAADATDRGDVGFNPQYLLDFIGSQVGIVGFGVFLGGLILVWMRRNSHTADLKFLIWFFLPIIILFALKSLTSKVQGNWIAMAYPAMVIFTVLSWNDWREQLAPKTRPRRVLNIVAVVSVLLSCPMTLAVYYPLTIFEMAGEKLMQTQAQLEEGDFSRSRFNASIGNAIQGLAKPILGWKDAGRLTSEIRSQMPNPEKTFVLTTSYHWAAEMAFYTEGQAQTMVCEATRMSQYDIWGGMEQHIGDDAVLVSERALSGLMPETLSAFEHVEAIGPVFLSYKDYQTRTIYLYKCYNLLSVPPAVQESY